MNSTLLLGICLQIVNTYQALPDKAIWKYHFSKSMVNGIMRSQFKNDEGKTFLDNRDWNHDILEPKASVVPKSDTDPLFLDFICD